MLLNKDSGEGSRLRLTSFIDVIFILLLFFIVTALIMKQACTRQGQKAYLKVQNSFSEVSRVNVYLTVFMYQSGGRVKYRLIHKGAKISPLNYLHNLAKESNKESPNRSAIIYTTTQMLRRPNSPLSREMDKLTTANINYYLRRYSKILGDNELSCAIVAQPNIPFWKVIQLYSFMKSPKEEEGLGVSNVVLLEFDGDLPAFLNRIRWK